MKKEVSKKKNTIPVYDHSKIEKKWQRIWDENKTYKTLDPKVAKNKKQKPCYVLDMFPYPSGAGLHVGHPRGYIGSDVYARMKRMQGYNVLHPMGYDAFGLPAEQYAIEHKIHPKAAVEVNVKTFEKQLSIMGLSFDWAHRVNTTDPEYYKWTQWIFLQLFDSYYDTKKDKARPIKELIALFEKQGNKNTNAWNTETVLFSAKEWKSFSPIQQQDILMHYRLAYETESEVNWCEKLGTVLANDEIVDGKDGKQVSERGGYPVEKMRINQWSMRITAYADRLLSGLTDLDWASSIKEIQKNWIGKEVNDHGVVTYQMRDAIFARQRYWGEPIPLYRDKNGIIHQVKKLPLELPKVRSYVPTGKAEGPLAGVKSWKDSGYETNTMPGWAGSSWYFLRYMDPQNKKSLVGEDEINYWKNVDMYVGGAEHATGHLLYARFWHKFLKDIGITKTEEPFKSMRNQGMIGGADGRKMSKRWGNVINPDDIVKLYGGDTLRVYEMFLGPFDSHLPWSTESIIGSRRFVERVWRAGMHVIEEKHATDIDVTYALNQVITKVENDILEFKFNTAISAMMIFIGIVEDKNYAISNDDFSTFLQLFAPFAPYMTEELYMLLGHKTTIHISGWPKEKKLKERKVLQKIIVQVNGKLRGEVFVEQGTHEEEIVGMVMMDDRLRLHVTAGKILRTIYIPMKLINFVVKSTD